MVRALWSALGRYWIDLCIDFEYTCSYQDAE